MKNIYNWLWYHVEFWLKPEDRRPFTYILRDIYHQIPLIAIGFYIGLGYVLGRFITFNWQVLAALLFGVILGHLFWGTKYKPGQQEKPEYIKGK